MGKDRRNPGECLFLLGLLHARAKALVPVGSVTAAERALDEAAATAVAAKATPGSELGVALTRVRALLAGAPRASVGS